ncbi:zinc finger, C6HC-type containing protein [Tanacetum coccineum]
MAKEDDDVNNGGEGGSVEQQQQVLVDKVEHLRNTYIHMAASSSTSDLGYNEVDDSYFAALIDDDEIFPISDEKYAEELQFQEALISSSSLLNIPLPKNDIASSSNTKPQPLVDSFESNQSPKNFCDICMDTKTESEMFRKTNVCSHLFCFDCIRGHVASKIKQNITTVTCPDPKCIEVIGPEACKTIVPQEVLERWESTLCESLIMESEKFYCPFKDCSVMLVDDGGEHVTSSECPHCNRLFCAQCKVTWHSGMDCSEYQSLKEDVRDPTDIMLMDLAENKKWRRCPSCKFYVERTEGCAVITSAMDVARSILVVTRVLSR